MSTGFSFGQKPNEPPAFGQTPFGSSQFGAPTPAPTTTSQFSSSFGPKPASSGFQFSTPVSTSAFGTSYNFNSPATQPNTTTPSFGYGTTTPAFGTATALPAALSFTTPSAAPAPSLFGTPLTTTGATSGFSTGMTKPAAPPFGSTSSGLFAMPTTTPAQTTGISFATPSTQMGSGIPFGTAQSAIPKMTFGQSPAPQFGSTATTTSGLSFGAAPTSTAKFSFGPTTTSAPLSFGATSTGINFSTPAPTQPTGLSFAPTTSNPTNLTFLTPATTVQNTGLSFMPTTGLSFGPPATTAPSTGMNFATPVSTVPLSGFSLSQPASTAAPTIKSTFATPASLATSTGGLGFSIPPSSVAATTLNFGTTTQSTTTPTAPTLSFTPSTGTSGFAAPTSVPTLLNFGTPTTSSSVPTTTAGAPFGLGGMAGIKTTTTSNVLSGFGLTSQPTTAASHTVGLGGVTSTPPKQTVPTTKGQSDIAPKDQALPNEILQTVQQFKKFVQEQKNFSSEIARFSIKDLRRVETDVDLVNNCMNEVENQLWKNKAIAEKLKLDSAKDLQNVEMAQRTYDTPSGLQYENTAPFNYFLELSDNFEKEMYELKARIENVNKHVRNSMNPAILSSQDLALGMRRLHETFVTLAGRLQSIHNQVEIQKEQYLSVRRRMLNDYTNVFEEQNKASDILESFLEHIGKDSNATGSPTPFNSLRSSQVQTLAQNNTSTAYPTGPTLGVPITTGFNVGPAVTLPLFGSNVTTTPSLFNQSTSNSFQLQKPPVGNKRGKP